MDKDKQIICPVCGTAIPSDAKICPHCKETLWSDEVPEEFGGGSATETSDGTPPPMLGEIYNRDFRPGHGAGSRNRAAPQNSRMAFPLCLYDVVVDSKGYRVHTDRVASHAVFTQQHSQGRLGDLCISVHQPRRK